MIIYKATNLVNKKSYIGLTSSTLKKRKSQHKHESLIGNSNAYFYKAIRKYGWDNFVWEVIDTAETQEELNKKEMYWISYYNSCVFFDGSNGYNLTYGGGGMVGNKPTIELRKKMSEAHHPSFSDEYIMALKKEFMKPHSLKEMSERYNINYRFLSSIKQEQCYKHVVLDGYKPFALKNRSVKITDQLIASVIELKCQAYSMRKIEKELEIPFSMVLKILKGIEVA